MIIRVSASLPQSYTWHFFPIITLILNEYLSALRLQQLCSAWRAISFCLCLSKQNTFCLYLFSFPVCVWSCVPCMAHQYYTFLLCPTMSLDDMSLCRVRACILLSQDSQPVLWNHVDLMYLILSVMIGEGGRQMCPLPLCSLQSGRGQTRIFFSVLLLLYPVAGT